MLRDAGIEPRSRLPREPNFDLAWEAGGTVFVAEIKGHHRRQRGRTAPPRPRPGPALPPPPPAPRPPARRRGPGPRTQPTRQILERPMPEPGRRPAQQNHARPRPRAYPRRRSRAAQSCTVERWRRHLALAVLPVAAPLAMSRSGQLGRSALPRMRNSDCHELSVTGPGVHRGPGLDVWLVQAGLPGRVREAGAPWYSMTRIPPGPPQAGALGHG